VEDCTGQAALHRRTRYDKRHARSTQSLRCWSRRSQVAGHGGRAAGLQLAGAQVVFQGCRLPARVYLSRLSAVYQSSRSPLALRCFLSTTSTAHRLSKHKCARSQLYSPLTACVIGSQLHSVRKRNAGISHSPRRRCAQPPQARSSAQPGRRGACLHPPHNSNINLPASHLLTPCPSSTTATPARTQPHTPDTHKMAEIRRKLVIVGDGACGKTCLLM
jgi:hypothetical protein